MRVRQRCLKVARYLANNVFRRTVRLMRTLHPEWEPRNWSNAELRAFGHLFGGEVINVSGWRDEDKQGGVYSEYFPNRNSYSISNYGGIKGSSGQDSELVIDVEKPLPIDLVGKFDVVFNHTMLEHVFDSGRAFDTLCALSRDLVIVVVPFMQIEHWGHNSYRDYHRMTGFGVQKYFEDRGFDVLYLSSNHNPVFPIYYFCIASSQPEKWREHFPPFNFSYVEIDNLGNRKRPVDRTFAFME